MVLWLNPAITPAEGYRKILPEWHGSLQIQHDTPPHYNSRIDIAHSATKWQFRNRYFGHSTVRHSTRSQPEPRGCPKIVQRARMNVVDRKSTRLNSSHPSISYAVFCLKKK